ncbi:unnamed protein product, partial [Choristocarpus tenellus]
MLNQCEEIDGASSTLEIDVGVSPPRKSMACPIPATTPICGQSLPDIRLGTNVITTAGAPPAIINSPFIPVPVTTAAQASPRADCTDGLDGDSEDTTKRNRGTESSCSRAASPEVLSAGAAAVQALIFGEGQRNAKPSCLMPTSSNAVVPGTLAAQALIMGDEGNSTTSLVAAEAATWWGGAVAGPAGTVGGTSFGLRTGTGQVSAGDLKVDSEEGISSSRNQSSLPLLKEVSRVSPIPTEASLVDPSDPREVSVQGSLGDTNEMSCALDQAAEALPSKTVQDKQVMVMPRLRGSEGQVEAVVQVEEGGVGNKDREAPGSFALGISECSHDVDAAPKMVHMVSTSTAPAMTALGSAATIGMVPTVKDRISPALPIPPAVSTPTVTVSTSVTSTEQDLTATLGQMRILRLMSAMNLPSLAVQGCWPGSGVPSHPQVTSMPTPRALVTALGPDRILTTLKVTPRVTPYKRDHHAARLVFTAKGSPARLPCRVTAAAAAAGFSTLGGRRGVTMGVSGVPGEKTVSWTPGPGPGRELHSPSLSEPQTLVPQQRLGCAPALGAECPLGQRSGEGTGLGMLELNSGLKSREEVLASHGQGQGEEPSPRAMRPESSRVRGGEGPGGELGSAADDPAGPVLEKLAQGGSKRLTTVSKIQVR